MKTILLTLVIAFPLVFANTTAQASWRPTSNADCANMSTQVNLCYLACVKQRPLGVGLMLLLDVASDPVMIQKSITLRAQNAICAGWAYDGGACRTINTVLMRFCRPDPSTGYWALKPIYRERRDSVRRN